MRIATIWALGSFKSFLRPSLLKVRFLFLFFRLPFVLFLVAKPSIWGFLDTVLIRLRLVRAAVTIFGTLSLIVTPVFVRTFRTSTPARCSLRSIYPFVRIILGLIAGLKLRWGKSSVSLLLQEPKKISLFVEQSEACTLENKRK